MHLKLTLVERDNLTEIESKWLSFEKVAIEHHFFLSWSWLQAWLQTSISTVYLVEVVHSDSPIAMAFLGIQKFAYGRCGFLNKSGDMTEDQAWIEYNDFLFHSELSQSEQLGVRSDIAAQLLNSKPLNLQALELDMGVHNYQKSSHYYCYPKLQSTGFLKAIKAKTNCDLILQTCSKNTRRQVTKSLQLLDAEGLLSLVPQKSIDEKRKALREIAPRHKSQWQATAWGSGFDNPRFVAFHQHLVKSPQSQILTLSLNNKPLAYGYYFCFNKHVYFYLSAVEKHSDNRIKVGLVLHTLAMAYFATEGFHYYDFLAGDARYKRSLSDSQYSLYSHRIVKKNWRGYGEFLLRKVKQNITKKLLTEK